MDHKRLSPRLQATSQPLRRPRRWQADTEPADQGGILLGGNKTTDLHPISAIFRRLDVQSKSLDLGSNAWAENPQAGWNKSNGLFVGLDRG